MESSLLSESGHLAMQRMDAGTDTESNGDISTDRVFNKSTYRKLRNHDIPFMMPFIVLCENDLKAACPSLPFTVAPPPMQVH